VADDDLAFEWDDAKASANRRKHGITFEAASFVFDDPFRLEEDDLFAVGEYRMIAIGGVDGLILTVIFSMPQDDVIRIISARPATSAERRAYDQNRLQS